MNREQEVKSYFGLMLLFDHFFMQPKLIKNTKDGTSTADSSIGVCLKGSILDKNLTNKIPDTGYEPVMISLTK